VLFRSTSITFKLWNISGETLSGPFKVVIEKMDNNDISLKNPDGYDGSGKAYYLYNQEKLSPKKMTANKKWIFEHKCKKITVVEFKEHKLLEIIFQGKCSNLVTVYVSIFAPGGNANHAPVANAGPDQTVYRTNQVQLDGSGSSDADNDPLTYQWSFSSKPTGSQAVISNPSAVRPSFVPDVAGTYVIQLIVNDGKVASVPDTVTITVNPRVVTVPNVVGLLQAEALSALSAVSLVAGSVTQEHSSAVSVDRVISQNPLAGASIPEGSAVNFVVSLGPVMVTVPNVVNMTQTAAQSSIAAAHLSLGTITTANHASIPTGSVISQNPSAGSSVPEGTSVSLAISLGPRMVNVPNVVGMVQANAEAAITAAGLKVGAISTKNSDTVVAGNIISQNPSSGTSVPQGSSVNLMISLGPFQAVIGPQGGTVDRKSVV
jgi:beta-lactam-binding protein with PASTA domain